MQHYGDLFNRRQISTRQQSDLFLPRDPKAGLFDNDTIYRDASAFDIQSRLCTGTIKEFGNAFCKTD
jgi:hypothetical protein